MAEVSTKGSKITRATASRHINVKKSNPDTPERCDAGYGSDGQWYSGYWSGGVCYGSFTPSQPQPDSTNQIDATIEGEVNEGSSNVFIGGKEVAFNGAKTNEKDSYSLNGWTYVSGSHTSASGSVTNGSSTVFVNGKAIARKGDTVRTHASSNTTISEGSSTVVAN